MVFHIMILETILDLIEQDLLVRNIHYELVSLRAIIHDMVLIFDFDRKSMFEMHLLSNKTVPNPGRVASVTMILVPAFQWKRKNAHVCHRCPSLFHCL